MSVICDGNLTNVKAVMERQSRSVTLESETGASSVFGLCFSAEEGEFQ
jgi:hypothetical protein